MKKARKMLALILVAIMIVSAFSVTTLAAKDLIDSKNAKIESIREKAENALYGYKLFDNNSADKEKRWVRFTKENPSKVEELTTVKSISVAGAEYINGAVYYITSTNYFYVIENFRKSWNGQTVSGAISEKVSVPFTDMTYDETNGYLYLASENGNLYSINMNDTIDSFKKVGELTQPLFTITDDGNGILYGVDIENNLVTVNKETAETTIVGATGVEPAYRQSMVYEAETGMILWAYTDDYESKLYAVNPGTAEMTDLGQIGESAEVCGMFLAENFDLSQPQRPEVENRYYGFRRWDSIKSKIGLVNFDVENIEKLTMKSMDDLFYMDYKVNAADYCEGIVYGIDERGYVFTLDLREKNIVLNYSETVVPSSESVRDMACDHSTNTMYFIAVTNSDVEKNGNNTSILYKLDMETLEIEKLKEYNNTYLNTLATRSDGYLYGVTVIDGNLKKIDINNNYSMSSAGKLSYANRGPQSMTYDEDSGLFYWAYGDDMSGFVAWVDIDKPSATFKCDFPNFDNITGFFIIPSVKYTVTFVDDEGNVLETQRVKEGDAATPETPTKEGYTFVGWDKDFSNVTEDMTVTAIFEINSYKVTFVDMFDNILKEEMVEFGSDATAPEAPEVEGYEFIGWDTDYTNVKKDLTVKALYSEIDDTEYHTVTFVGFNGEILKVEEVEDGKSATAPEAPEIEGYKFTGWDKEFDVVTEDMTVKAIYEEIETPLDYILGDVNKDGIVDSADATAVLRYVAKLDEFDEIQLLAGDVNKDGVVDSADATIILRVVAKLETL